MLALVVVGFKEKLKILPKTKVGNLVVYVNVVFDLSTSLNGQRGRRQEQELPQVDLFPGFVDGGKPKTGAEAFLAQCAMGKGQIFLCGFCSPLET